MTASTAVVTAQEQRRAPGRPFEPGRSGNPRGRPAGSRNRATLVAEALLEAKVEAVVAKVVELALEGDVAALRLCLERLVPPCRDRPVTVELPRIENAADVVAASSALIEAVASGAITPSEGVQLARLMEVHVQALETHDLDERVAALEGNAGNGGP